MVDPQSWIRHSEYRDEHEIHRIEALKAFSKYKHRQYLGCGCECMFCDKVLDTADDILPIRDFLYTERDSSHKALNDDFYLLCTPVLRGYGLNERRWGIKKNQELLLTLNNY
jgi:hypothetical protein